MTVILGIDPGITGAIARISQSGAVEVWDMPANPRDLADLLRCGLSPKLVIVEQAQAMPHQGVSSTFKTGQGYGVLLGVLAALGVPYRTVTPAVWKRDMGLSGKGKEASRALGRSLWPDAPLGRKMDHGRAEALLLAEWGWRQEAKNDAGNPVVPRSIRCATVSPLPNLAPDG